MGDERDYNLAVLVILLLLCWPLAIVYYYTRPKKASPYPYGWQASPPPTTAGDFYCRNCNNKIPNWQNSTYCPYCGQPLGNR